ncbi:MAG: hypothetical protein ACM3VT_15965, partial [Solirubrobacterales bacterium]
RTFNVFHVPEAVGSPDIPEQAEFVIPHGVRSVLGFGGMLPGRDLFAVILFSQVPIPRSTAELFRPLALCVKAVGWLSEGRDGRPRFSGQTTQS